MQKSKTLKQCHHTTDPTISSKTCHNLRHHPSLCFVFESFSFIDFHHALCNIDLYLMCFPAGGPEGSPYRSNERWEMILRDPPWRWAFKVASDVSKMPWIHKKPQNRFSHLVWMEESNAHILMGYLQNVHSAEVPYIECVFRALRLPSWLTD